MHGDVLQVKGKRHPVEVHQVSPINSVEGWVRSLSATSQTTRSAPRQTLSSKRTRTTSEGSQNERLGRELGSSIREEVTVAVKERRPFVGRDDIVAQVSEWALQSCPLLLPLLLGLCQMA